MTKGKGKGGKNRRRGTNSGHQIKRDLQIKDNNQEYAIVQKMLGNGRLMAFCSDGKERLCHIRGSMRKKVWINKDDTILIGLRDFQDNKADVILKYSTEEVRELIQRNELPERFGNDDNDNIDQADILFTFDKESSNEQEKELELLEL